MIEREEKCRGLLARNRKKKVIKLRQTTLFDKTKADNFVWTDDEVQLLLEVTNDYKVSKAAKNIDWESCQSKYTDILELYREHYPNALDKTDWR